MLSKISKLLFFLACLFPAVSAKLPLSDMFHFGIREYIPYIIVTSILLIAFIPIRQLKIPRIIISEILAVFLALIFPPIFSYMIQGLSKLTIVMIAFSCALITSFIIIKLISMCIDDIDDDKKTQTALGITLMFLIFSIFPPLFLYATESFNGVTIPFLVLHYLIIIAIPLCFIENNVLRIICAIIMSLSIFGIIIYALVLLIKSAIKSANFFFLIALAVNSVVGCCLGCLQNTIVGAITGCILCGIDYYVLFYAFLTEVNKVSLLLFWADLWAVLFAIYITIELYIKEELNFQEKLPEFNLGNFMS
jgi:hypothetical protein